MNIFWLDLDPAACAQMHCDKHVVKMILELAQLMCTAHRVLDGVQKEKLKTLSNGRTRRQKIWELHDTRNDTLYSATHVNHPCAVWVRNCSHNYTMCYELFMELCKEYTKRYKKVHLCETKLSKILYHCPVNIIRSTCPSEPPQAMPDEYKVLNNPVQAYRNYYIGSKAQIAQWNHSPTPFWFRA